MFEKTVIHNINKNRKGIIATVFRITKKRLKKEIKQIDEVNRNLAEKEDHIKVQTNYIKENFNIEMPEVPYKSCRCIINMIKD